MRLEFSEKNNRRLKNQNTSNETAPQFYESVFRQTNSVGKVGTGQLQDENFKNDQDWWNLWPKTLEPLSRL